MTKTTLFLAFALSMANSVAFAKGDATKGKSLAYTCTGCHGIAQYKNAYPSYYVPKIAGQNETYIVAALTAYSKGERNHPTMGAQAKSFSAQEIADIAAYVSAQKTAK
jgi:cytochrome c553